MILVFVLFVDFTLFRCSPGSSHLTDFHDFVIFIFSYKYSTMNHAMNNTMEEEVEEGVRNMSVASSNHQENQGVSQV